MGVNLLCSERIKDTFKKTVNSIDTLIDEQISKAKARRMKVTGIVLVGGVGCSPYLHAHLKTRYSSSGINIVRLDGMKP